MEILDERLFYLELCAKYGPEKAAAEMRAMEDAWTNRSTKGVKT